MLGGAVITVMDEIVGLLPTSYNENLVFMGYLGVSQRRIYHSSHDSMTP